jgi:hypothetical protein
MEIFESLLAGLRTVCAGFIDAGGPGAGETWLLQNFVERRTNDGDAVVFLYAEDYAATTIKELEESLEVSNLVDALRAYEGKQRYQKTCSFLPLIQEQLCSSKILSTSVFLSVAIARRSCLYPGYALLCQGPAPLLSCSLACLRFGRKHHPLLRDIHLCCSWARKVIQNNGLEACNVRMPALRKIRGINPRLFPGE